MSHSHHSLHSAKSAYSVAAAGSKAVSPTLHPCRTLYLLHRPTTLLHTLLGLTLSFAENETYISCDKAHSLTLIGRPTNNSRRCSCIRSYSSSMRRTLGRRSRQLRRAEKKATSRQRARTRELMLVCGLFMYVWSKSNILERSGRREEVQALTTTVNAPLDNLAQLRYSSIFPH